MQDQPSMRRSIGLAAALCLNLWSGAVGAHGTSFAEPPVEPQFQTPTGNIGCAFEDWRRYENLRPGEDQVFLRCEVAEMTPSYRKRPADCDLDWGQSFSVGGRGKAHMPCHGDTVRNPEAIRLEYGASFSFEGITCTSERSGLTCRNRDGHGFTLSRARQKLF